MLSHTTRMLLAVLCLQVAPALAADEVAAPDHPILDAWRRQQDAVTSAKFLLLGRQSIVIPGEVHQKLESNFKLSFSFMGANGCSLIESNRAVANADLRSLQPVELVVAFDGEEQARTLVTHSENARAMGYISDPVHGNRELRIPALRPLALAFRAFAEPFTPKTLDEYRSAPTNEDSTRQLLAVDIRRLYVDAEAPFAARRFVFGVEANAPFNSCEITEVKVVDDLWIPMKWTVTFYDGHGAITSQESYKLAVHELNPALTVDDFRIKFPEGTYVETEFADRFLFGVVEGGEIRDTRPMRMRLKRKR